MLAVFPVCLPLQSFGADMRISTLRFLPVLAESSLTIPSWKGVCAIQFVTQAYLTFFTHR